MAAEPLKAKECFVICPIGVVNSDTRKRSNQISEYVIKPIAESFGYTVTRGDTIEHSGQITTQVIEKVLEVDLVIADLTDQNPNVFYELALRHATKKPFVHLIADDQTIPFDLRGWRAISLDYRDLDSVHNAKKELHASLEYIDQGKPVESPVTSTLNWQQLNDSDSTEERAIAELMSEVRTMRYMLDRSLPALRAVEGLARLSTSERARHVFQYPESRGITHPDSKFPKYLDELQEIVDESDRRGDLVRTREELQKMRRRSRKQRSGANESDAEE